MAFYTFVTTSTASNSEYRFVSIVCECKFQHSNSDFYLTGFHIGAVSVNVHIYEYVLCSQIHIYVLLSIATLLPS